ncbi:beta-defensin-like 1 [Lepisosteus oculatus]|uniref:beta-defensin-like 1 n=1 Tax=Lepisosteus oculatus TaxID=7918 RepID=UPI003712CB39
MNCQRLVLLVVLAFLTMTHGAEVGSSFPWGCSNYSGVCRTACLPQELPFGPLGCDKGFVCCVSHIF